jgi:hypothetical protein
MQSDMSKPQEVLLDIAGFPLAIPGDNHERLIVAAAGQALVLEVWPVPAREMESPWCRRDG